MAKNWPRVGNIVKLVYGKKYPGMPYQFRHAKVLLIARSKPMNVLVLLWGGTKVVVPIGNVMVDQN
jgi:hypothetical protein